MQAPYNLTVKGPSYTSLLQITNAEAKGNITNGTANLIVKDPKLAPNTSNMANVTLTLAASSQVGEGPPLPAVKAYSVLLKEEKCRDLPQIMRSFMA